MAGSRSSRRAKAAQSSTAWQTVRDLPTEENVCYECGGPHLVRDCPDVKCYRCGGSHLARNCNRPENKMDSGRGGAPRLARSSRKDARNDQSLKPGDWLCATCGDHQFARNAKCRMCGAARPACGSGNSVKEDAVAPKIERRVLSDVARPDSAKPSKIQQGGKGGKPSWADIVDEEEREEEAGRMNTPTTSTSAGVSDVSSQGDNSPSEDCAVPHFPSEMAWQQQWDEPMAGVAGNGLPNDPETFDETAEASKAGAMNPEACMVMCGTTWSGLWWPPYSEQPAFPAMHQCPNGHQLVDEVISADENYICDGCGSKVQCGEHVLECRPCNWGYCKRFCCGEATVLNPGDRVRSLCEEPSWNPRPLQIGDEGTVVENLPNCRVAVAFDGVTGWLYAVNLVKLDAGESGLQTA